MSDEKEFVDIPGYEGYYQINLLGQIKSLARTITRKDGRRKFIKERLIRLNTDDNGYLMAALSKNGKTKSARIHRILGITFIPNPENLPLVRHLNDIPSDNRLKNLAWGAPENNMEDAINNGRHHVPKGETHSHYGKKGEYSQTSKIIVDLENGVFYHGIGEAALAKGINKATLGDYLRGKIKNKTSLVYV